MAPFFQYSKPDDLFGHRCRARPGWDRACDVVVVGSGATGLPAAIVAREAGCSVIVVEAETDIGGHAITSGGNVPLGGGVDGDFAKPSPRYKIARPPFYAAWATPVVHDTRAGLRINAQCRVLDMNGAVIPGLYCGGESAGGFSQHGLARAVCQGYIAGNDAAAAAPLGLANPV